MNRRNFLRALLAAPAAAQFDPERLLWVPGKRLISIPAQSPELLIPWQYITAAMLELVHSQMVVTGRIMKERRSVVLADEIRIGRYCAPVNSFPSRAASRS